MLLTAPKDIVIAQAPTAGTMVAPKTRVRLSYNYVPSTRFPWVMRELVRERVLRDAMIRPGG